MRIIVWTRRQIARAQLRRRLRQVEQDTRTYEASVERWLVRRRLEQVAA